MAGHSRTIVGVEKIKEDDFNLLIFDPCTLGPLPLFVFCDDTSGQISAVWGKNLPTDITNGKLQKLRRTARSLTQKQYQIVAIADSALIRPDELTSLKRIRAAGKIVASSPK